MTQERRVSELSRLLRNRVATGILLGAVVGLMLVRRPHGALLGAIAGWLVQRSLARSRAGAKDARADARARAPGLVRLGVAVARASGGLDPASQAAIRTWFAADEAANAEALLAAAERAAAERPNAAAKALLAEHSLDRKERLHVLFLQFRVALAGRRLADAADEALRDTARGLGLADDDYRGMRAEFVAAVRGRAAAADWSLLGLAPGAGPDEVRERYREAVRTYHPDRFEHLGSDFAKVAAEKFKAIQGAYERVSGSFDEPSRPRTSRCPNCRAFTAVEDETCIRCGDRKAEREGPRLRIRCAFCGARPWVPVAARGVLACETCRVVLVQ